MAFVRGVPPSQMSNASLTKVYCPISRCPAAIRKVVDRSLKLSSVWSRLKKNCKRMGSAPNKKPIRLTRLHLEFWGDAEKYIGHLGAIVSIALGGPFLIGAVAPFSLARYTYLSFIKKYRIKKKVGVSAAELATCYSEGLLAQTSQRGKQIDNKLREFAKEILE